MKMSSSKVSTTGSGAAAHEGACGVSARELESYQEFCGNRSAEIHLIDCDIQNGTARMRRSFLISNLLDK
jgi:hypothetical protein